MGFEDTARNKRGSEIFGDAEVTGRRSRVYYARSRRISARLRIFYGQSPQGGTGIRTGKCDRGGASLSQYSVPGRPPVRTTCVQSSPYCVSSSMLFSITCRTLVGGTKPPTSPIRISRTRCSPLMSRTSVSVMGTISFDEGCGGGPCAGSVGGAPHCRSSRPQLLWLRLPARSRQAKGGAGWSTASHSSRAGSSDYPTKLTLTTGAGVDRKPCAVRHDQHFPS